MCENIVILLVQVLFSSHVCGTYIVLTFGCTSRLYMYLVVMRCLLGCVCGSDEVFTGLGCAAVMRCLLGWAVQQ